MENIEDIQIDVGELTLGFGKHKGEKLKDVPQDYLLFMFTEFDDGKFWKTRAEQELRRRKHVAQYGQDVPPCSHDAVNQLSKTKLLRHFITRTDQSLGIYEWSQEFVTEVRRHGYRYEPTKIEYLGFIFDFEYVQNRYILMKIRPARNETKQA